MENKLTLEHLKGYLGTGLKVKMNKTGSIYKVTGFRKNDDSFKYLFFSNSDCYSDECKPILRPLSDLTKFCEDLGFVPIEELLCEGVDIEIGICGLKIIQSKDNDWIWFVDLQTQIIQKLYKWHFDIHGLIEKGLAIDINKLNE